MTAEAVIPLFFLGLLGSKEKDEVLELGHEAYNLRWSPRTKTATTEYEFFIWTFADGKKRYLRAVSVTNDSRIVDVGLTLREATGVTWEYDVKLKSSPSHPVRHNYAGSIFTWNGDIPIKGEVIVTVRGCTVGDVVSGDVLYEEK